jgi:hypothetical protein
MWNFNWHHEEAKEDALQKGLPIPDEAAIREQVLRKNVEASDLATVKDFLRFYAAASKGKIKEKITTDSLNTFAEWSFAGFSRITDTDRCRRQKRSPRCEYTPLHMVSPISSLLVGSKGLDRGRFRGQHQKAETSFSQTRCLSPVTNPLDTRRPDLFLVDE